VLIKENKTGRTNFRVSSVGIPGITDLKNRVDVNFVEMDRGKQGYERAVRE
jgi:hypothetical protein